MLLEAAWNYDFEPRGNIIDMHIHRLRRKLDHGFEDCADPDRAGYRLPHRLTRLALGRRRLTLAIVKRISFSREAPAIGAGAGSARPLIPGPTGTG